MQMNGGLQNTQVPQAPRDAGAMVKQTDRARENANRLESFCSALDTAMERFYGAMPESGSTNGPAGPEKQMAGGALSELIAVNERTERLLSWLAVITEKVNGIA